MKKSIPVVVVDVMINRMQLIASWCSALCPQLNYTELLGLWIILIVAEEIEVYKWWITITAHRRNRSSVTMCYRNDTSYYLSNANNIVSLCGNIRYLLIIK